MTPEMEADHRRFSPECGEDLAPDFREQRMAKSRGRQRAVVLECQRRGVLAQLSADSGEPESALLELVAED